MIETTREQDDAVFDICRTHHGALCQITRPDGVTTGITLIGLSIIETESEFA